MFLRFNYADYFPSPRLQGLMRMREQANQNFLRQPQMIMQNGMANLRRNGVPNMNNMNLQKTALQNNASGINASAMYVYNLRADQTWPFVSRIC